MLAVRVPSHNAEAARLLLADRGLVDKHHRISSQDGWTDIPVLSLPPGDMMDRLRLLNAVLASDREYAGREPFREPFREILAVLDPPPGVRDLLPRRWEKLGHVLILKLDETLKPHFRSIAEAYAIVLGADTVLRDTGGIRGRYREPVTELLLGENTETVHVENGIRYWLDAARIMFSSGNVDERIRMASVCQPGETVVDMFAGIGYFTLPMAVHSAPASIIAHEINPLAFEYLERNIRENGVADRIKPVLADCLNAPEDIADRVVMGYVGRTHEYLPKAMRILKPEGGIVHYHETCPERLLPDRPLSRIRAAAGDAGRVLAGYDIHRIKSYAPGVEHVVVDAIIS